MPRQDRFTHQVTPLNAIYRLVILLIGVVISLLSPLSQADHLVLDEDLQRTLTTPYISVLEDPQGQLKLEDILNSQWQTQFRKLDNGTTAHGVSRSAWWVRFNLKNPHYEEIEWIVEAIHNTTDFVDAYQIRDGKLIERWYQGDHRNPHNKPIQSEGFAFPFSTPALTEDTIYLRFKYESSGIINLYHEISGHEAFHTSHQNKTIWLGVILGAALMVIAYHLFLLITLKEITYLWYFFYASSATGLFLALSGLGYSHLWGTHIYLADNLPNLFAAGFMLFAIQFSRSFLQLKTFAPTMDKVLKYVALTALLIVAFIIVDWREAVLHLIMLLGMLLALLPLLGIYLWRKGFFAARLYTLAWILWSVTVITSILRFKGYLPTDPLAINATRYGMLLETLLIAFALADRINILRKEKQQLMQAHKQALFAAQNELEDKVKARTQAIEQSRQEAEHLARRDPLTGLLNRRALFELASCQFSEAVKQGSPLSVIMLDIDHFKAVNDNYGHAAGDIVLQKVAETLETYLRDDDLKARMGGEEFVLIMASTEQAIALQMAERLRQQIASMSIKVNGNSIRISSSFGVATLNAEESLEQLMDQADQALYQAKRNGRNRVETI